MNKTILLTFLLVSLIFAKKCNHGHSHTNDLANMEGESQSERWSEWDLWVYGMSAGAFVSLIGYLAAFILILLKRNSQEKYFAYLIQILFAFSCGALLGDVVMHILPQAYDSPHTDQQYVSLCFISAIIFFLLLERFFQAQGIAHSHWHDQDSHTHQTKEIKPNQPATQSQQLNKESKDPKHEEIKARTTKKQVTGYLNLFSSLLHNFIDGLAIGVAFSTGNAREFIPITMGIIAHEIPREMGDVAILIKSGFSERETINSNGIVNLISLVGCFLGLNSQDLSESTKQYVLVFVAGNFIYIAADIWKNLIKNKNIFLNFLELAAIILGIQITLNHTH